MTHAGQTIRDLHPAVAGIAGARLLTITKIDHASGLSRRIYSSHSIDYLTLAPSR